MSNETATQKRNTKAEKIPALEVPDTGTDLPLIYELVTRGKSGWKKKGTENDRNPQTINCCKSLPLKVTSTYNMGGRLGDVKIQYVPGAPTIFVNDYVDKNGVQQKGLKSLGYDLGGVDYRTATEENIQFVNGLLNLDKYGGINNPLLLEFVHHHASNEASPNYKRNPRKNPLFLFKPLVKERKAAKQLDNLEVENEIHTMFTKLRTKKGDSFEYDTAKINAILAILDIGGDLSDNESSQKMLAIAPYVKDAVKFKKAYDTAIESTTKTINVANKLGVIKKNDTGVTLHISNVPPFDVTLEGKTEEERTEQLIFHFLGNNEGAITYQQVESTIEDKKIENL